MGSVDNFSGKVVGGPPAVNIGCGQWQVSKVEIVKDGKPTKDTLPNNGGL